ncbi:MAG: nucleoside phosphorylase [Chloroflexota bacterium]
MSLSELPITGLPVDQVSPSVIVCGDPARADQIAARLNDGRLISNRREYRAYRGTYQDKAITVCSHGVGAPGAAVAFEELIIAGAQRILRVGTCGGLQPDIQTGQLIIATAAVQNTGYGRETAPEGYPAVADLVLTQTLRQAAETAGHSIRAGIVLSRDNFYAGVPAPAAPDYRVMSQARVLAVEMECAALFVVGSLRGIATAAILAVDGNVLEASESVETYRPGQEVVHRAVESAIELALESSWTVML